eukprot:141038_1
MSTSIASNSFILDTSDAYTPFIVMGYFVMPSESLLLRQRYFPKEIISITAKYIGGHFILHQGCYQWNIDNDILHQMQHSAPDAEFESTEINMAGLKWTLHAYPNGHDEDDDSTGFFCLFLKLKSMPLKWKTIIFRIHFQCTECIVAQYTRLVSVDHNDRSNGWHPDTLLELSEVQKLKTLTFIIQVQIVRIILNESDKIFYNYLSEAWNPDIVQLFRWNIADNLLHEMKHIGIGKAMISKIYHNMWCIVIYPNGYNEAQEGQCYIGLQLCAFPKDTEELLTSWQLCIKEIGETYTWCNTFTLDEDRWGVDDLLSTDKFMKLDSLSITVNVNYVSMDDRMVDMEWSEYVRQNEKVLKMIKFDQQQSKLQIQHQNDVSVLQELRKINQRLDTILEMRDT